VDMSVPVVAQDPTSTSESTVRLASLRFTGPKRNPRSDYRLGAVEVDEFDVLARGLAASASAKFASSEWVGSCSIPSIGSSNGSTSGRGDG
jgi:hypothetical protein